MSVPENIDVLIVGAGPTGLMLGNQLGRLGVRALIVDRNSGPSIHTKALAVHARSLEIYAHLGIAEKALELGMRASAANLWVEGRRAARVPLGDIGRDLSPYPFVLILGQDDNEKLLGEALHEGNFDIAWDTELANLEQHADHVLATLQQADGKARVIRARWVAGCDGPHSAVRKLCEIDFPGAPYEHVFFVADTSATGPMTPAELNVYLRRDGFILFFPMRGPDHWRVVGILPRKLAGRNDLDFVDVSPSVRELVDASLDFRECRWFSTYRIQHRTAERFRDCRCFLLGDAAHIHSPVGGQGMNTGLQDAYNLAWKLAFVVDGLADESLLDSYEAERILVARRLVRTTDRAFTFIVSSRWMGGVFRVRVLSKLVACAMRLDGVRKSVFRLISQIGISYRKSPLSETLPGLPEGAPKAGDRFPWLHLKFSPDGLPEDLFARLDDTRFNLILIGQPSLSLDLPEFEDLVIAHVVSGDPANKRELARAAIPVPSFYLLRPDCHIGLAGTRFDPATVNRYLTERLGLRGGERRSTPITSRPG